MNTGKIIVIEGGDASGKATQSALLKEHLAADGVPVAQLDFPRYYDNHVGKLLRECLDGKRGDFMNIDPRITSVLFAADRMESKPQIEAWLAEGKTVILDRYTSANMLHQAAKIEDDRLRREAIEWMYRLEHRIFGLPVPSALFYLAVPAAKRLELLQRQHEDDGRPLDVAEIDSTHQENVDRFAGDVVAFFEGSQVVHCMEGESLRSVDDIHADIYQNVRAIMDQS